MICGAYQNGVDGIEAGIWTHQQPAAQNNFRASPIGICTTQGPQCNGFFVETGYVKGDNTPNPNVLQQYVSWKDVNNNIGAQFGLGNLNDFTEYEFRVIHRAGGTKWAIHRDGVKVWTTIPIGFAAGNLLICGAEGFQWFTDIAVQCSDMKRRLNGGWANFNYATTQTSIGYCVFKPEEFGALGWGIC